MPKQLLKEAMDANNYESIAMIITDFQYATLKINRYGVCLKNYLKITLLKFLLRITDCEYLLLFI